MCPIIKHVHQVIPKSSQDAVYLAIKSCTLSLCFNSPFTSQSRVLVTKEKLCRKRQKCCKKAFFSLSHNVFNLLNENFHHLNYIYFVIYNCFHLDKCKILLVGKNLKSCNIRDIWLTISSGVIEIKCMNKSKSNVQKRNTESQCSKLLGQEILGDLHKSSHFYRQTYDLNTEIVFQYRTHAACICFK